MPLEINEIGISMRVRDAMRGPEERKPVIPQGDCQNINREEIVDDCVRRILQILKSLEGR
jgi:hypothetical protein